MAAEENLRVNPEDLMCAAAHVTGQSEDLAAGHLSADNRIESAQSGWVGMSAIALDTKMADWLQKSTVLVARIGDHAFELQDAAIQHAAAEAERAQELGSVGGVAASVVGSTGLN